MLCVWYFILRAQKLALDAGMAWTNINRREEGCIVRIARMLPGSRGMSEQADASFREL